MKKETAMRQNPSKKIIHKKEMPKAELHQLEEKLVENLVELQKVHTNLAIKFDDLAKQISSLLNLFEMAARSFMEQPIIRETEKDKEFLDKVDKLIEQNKLIAKGLDLMEERLREKVYGAPLQHPVHHQVRHIQHPIHHIRPEERKEELPPTGSPGRPLPKF